MNQSIIADARSRLALKGVTMAWWESFARENIYAPSTVLTCILLSFSASWFLVFASKRIRKNWLIDQIPGPKTVPLFGNALEVNVEPKEIVTRIDGFMRTRIPHSSFIRAWMGSRPVILLARGYAVEAILSSHKHIDKSSDYSFLHPWLGTGLLTATGKKWHKRRKMLTPAFHFKILDDFVEVFNQQSFRLISLLNEKADGKPFDIFRFITLLTLDIILETAMGRSVDAQNNSDSEYVRAVYRIGALVQKRQSRPWLHPTILFKLLGYAKEHDACLKILHGFSYETIRERRKEYKELQALKANEVSDEDFDVIGKKQKRLAFLDLLLDCAEEHQLSDEDIREEVDTFMFEGHDTTAAAINWTTYLLGANPKIQEQVHQELESIFGDSDRSVTSSDLKEMKFLECCIKEALRLFPSVPLIARELKEDIVIDGYTIPSGTTALIVTYRLHRDPMQFPDPEMFKPERFFSANAVGRHPYAYIPFSAGPRNCIGQKFAQMEEKIVLANIFRKFRVESTVRREDLKILGELILRPEGGNMVKLFPK